ncbi:MAG TPA: hypothetical protein DCS93_40480 [Microscillaceae bacterium]|nr:hypothetical protein [Microscillaceae bacterium]
MKEQTPNEIFTEHLTTLEQSINEEVRTYLEKKSHQNEEDSKLKQFVDRGKKISQSVTDNMVARFAAKRLGIDKLNEAGVKALSEAGLRLDSPLMKHLLANDTIGEQINQIVQEYNALELAKKVTYDRHALFYHVVKAHNEGDLKTPESVKGKAMQVTRKLTGGGIGAINSLRKGKFLGAAASMLNSGTDILKTTLGRDTTESRLRLLLLTEISELCKRKERF